MKNIFKHKKVTVMGLGVFSGGVEAARFLVAKGAEVLVTDLKNSRDLGNSVARLKGQPVTLRLGKHLKSDFTGADIILVSPAVPKDSPYLVAGMKAGARIETEMNLVFELTRVPIIGITGSNGKTTTTALIGRIFSRSGLRSLVGGNIGCSLINRVGSLDRKSTVVLELSSFQLDDLAGTGRSPQVAVVTNITPNHLDRHGTMRNYVKAKKAIIENQKKTDVAILNYDDRRVRNWARDCRGKVYYFSLRVKVPKGAYLEGGDIMFTDGKKVTRIAPAGSLLLPGRHNLANALAAVTAARVKRVPRSVIRQVLSSFRGVEHRLELVRSVGEVRYYNDSIATTPESTIAALRSFNKPITLIAGGYDKRSPFDGLGTEISRKVRVLILMGATSRKIERAVTGNSKGRVEIKMVNSLRRAVQTAHKLSVPDSTVLLSPACASYDMFNNFSERGDRFRDLVRNL